MVPTKQGTELATLRLASEHGTEVDLQGGKAPLGPPMAPGGFLVRGTHLLPSWLGSDFDINQTEVRVLVPLAV